MKVGGYSALYMALAYIIGMVGFLSVANVSEGETTQEKLSIIIDNQLFLTIMYVVVYLVLGVFLIMLALSLYQILKEKMPVLVQTATVMALVWACVLIGSGLIYIYGMETVVSLNDIDTAQAGTVWITMEAVSEASGIEFIGGVWVFLISIVALKANKLQKILNYFGVFIGLAGLVSVLPGLVNDVGVVFGAGQIIWFIWLGIILLKNSKQSEEQIVGA